MLKVYRGYSPMDHTVSEPNEKPNKSFQPTQPAPFLRKLGRVWTFIVFSKFSVRGGAAELNRYAEENLVSCRNPIERES